VLAAEALRADLGLEAPADGVEHRVDGRGAGAGAPAAAHHHQAPRRRWRQRPVRRPCAGARPAARGRRHPGAPPALDGRRHPGGRQLPRGRGVGGVLHAAAGLHAGLVLQ